jgi:hypothetical protein
LIKKGKGAGGKGKTLPLVGDLFTHESLFPLTFSPLFMLGRLSPALSVGAIAIIERLTRQQNIASRFAVENIENIKRRKE